METGQPDSASTRDGTSRSDARVAVGAPGRPTATFVSDVQTRLRTGGALAALACLKARVRFRFTGLYHADPPVLRNLYLVDRENPTLNLSGQVCPLDETYCAITCAREASFSTTDARLDARLHQHPARSSVISYAGVPLRLVDGSSWGTLCHFDLRPRLLPATELALLDAVAPLFVDWLWERRRPS